MSSLMALDVGGGTRDLLFWRKEEPVENAIKLVEPSPTQVVAARIRRARAEGKNAHLTGWLMGGGAMGRAVKEHLAAGLKVSAEPGPAASLADNLERVEAMGVQIADKAPAGFKLIFTSDINYLELIQRHQAMELPQPGALALAVCDHGYSPGFSNRKFRFAQWLDFLEAGGRLDDLVLESPPVAMTRMAALAEQAPGAWLMDTAAAALWGALQDAKVAGLMDQGVCVVNLGNMHTVGFIAKKGVVLGVYEHHTSCLDGAKLFDHISRFMAGRITDDEVFDDNGHGCARLDQAPSELPGPVVVTGPRRAMARNLGWHVAAPYGDVMLSGCFGLAAAVAARLGEADFPAVYQPPA